MTQLRYNSETYLLGGTMNAVDQGFYGLRQMIASGELAPGAQFPPENQLCERLKISRGSLREAVRMLGALGVIESRHGSGTYVSDLSPERIIGVLALTVGLMPLEGVLDMCEPRRVLEGHATAQAAAHMTDAAIAELEMLCERMESSPSVEDVAELDADFHEGIALLSGNKATFELLRVFRTRSRLYPIFDLPNGVTLRQRSDESHRSIVAALRARDAGAAGTAASAHVSQTEAWLRQYRPSPTTSRDVSI
jgi:GntR family transcriptional repressor for pyruvate dehydrogenase complex